MYSFTSDSNCEINPNELKQIVGHDLPKKTYDVKYCQIKMKTPCGLDWKSPTKMNCYSDF